MMLKSWRTRLTGVAPRARPASVIKPKPSIRAEQLDDPSTRSEPACRASTGNRLLSWEFILYWLVLAYAAFTVLYLGVGISRRLDDRRPGVIGFYKRLGLRRYMKTTIDQSDLEWVQLRMVTLPVIIILAIFVFASYLVRCHVPKQRTHFYVVAGLVFAGYLHETRLLLLLIAAAINFFTAKAVAGKPHGLTFIWAWNIMYLLMRHLSAEYSLILLDNSLLASFTTRSGLIPTSLPLSWFSLRMLSYSLDLHQLRMGPGNADGLKPPSANSLGDSKAKEPKPRIEVSFSAGSYLAYLFYPPLYISGPVMTFKSFSSQLQSPVAFHQRQVWRYAGKVLLLSLCFELSCHLVYMHAIAVSGAFLEMKSLKGFPIEGRALISMAAFSVLFLFLKNAALWRVGRLWAMLDSFSPPENANLTASSLFSQQVFWKSWNTSLHQWLLQYIYRPLEGRERPYLSTLWSFLFVALLVGGDPGTFAWAVCAAFGLLAEQAASRALLGFGAKNELSESAMRHIQALLAAANAAFLFFLLLGGFGLGDRVGSCFACLISTPFVALGTLLTFFAAAQVVLELSKSKALSQCKPHSSPKLEPV